MVWCVCDQTATPLNRWEQVIEFRKIQAHAEVRLFLVTLKESMFSPDILHVFIKLLTFKFKIQS